MEKKYNFTTQEIYSGKNQADLEEGLFIADYVIYNFASGEGVAYGDEGYIEFFLTADEIDRMAQYHDTVGAGDIFQAAWDHYDSRGWKKIIQEKIKSTLEVWLEKINNNQFTKDDNRWIPRLEDFCLNENPCKRGRFLIWGWGRQSGLNPQNYSWIVYDPKYPDRFQMSWKRGNYTSTRDISLTTCQDIYYGFNEFDEFIHSIIKPDFWLEDCTI